MVLKAYERGEKIEVSHYCEIPETWRDLETTTVLWNFPSCKYRIAPKKLSLVEELRLCAESGGVQRELLIKAADRIEELEKALEYDCSKELTTDELLAEIKRRME